MERQYSTSFQKPKTGRRDPSLLKNIRQIGMPSSGYKLYIEDSVLSYLKHQMKKEDNRVIALIGSETQSEEDICLFVEGAIEAQDIFVNGKNLSFGKKAFTSLYENMNTFFDDCSLLGWYVPMYEMIRNYGSALGEKCKLFVLDDPTSQDEMFYIKEMNKIKKLNGYNIFYEKNDAMKNYLISRKESLINEQEFKKDANNADKIQELKNDKINSKKENEIADNGKSSTLLYVACCILAIVILIVGITTMNGYEQINDIKSSLETLANSVSESFLSGNEKDTTSETSMPSPTETIVPLESDKTDDSDENTVSSDNVDVVEYYVVKEGDTLAGISMKLYDSLNMVEEICRINSIENEDSLYIGQKIYLPQE